MVMPVLLMRKRHIIDKLLKMNAVSEEKAVTFREAGVINPNGFHRFTLHLVDQGILHQCGEKYYLGTTKL